MAKRKNAIGKTVEKIVFILSVLVAAGSWSICLLEKLSIHKIPVVCTFVGTSFCVLAVLAFSHYNENRLFSFFGKYSLEIYTMHTFLTAANRSILIRGGQKLCIECVFEFYNKHIGSGYDCSYFEKVKIA